MSVSLNDIVAKLDEVIVLQETLATTIDDKKTEVITREGTPKDYQPIFDKLVILGQDTQTKIDVVKSI